MLAVPVDVTSGVIVLSSVGSPVGQSSGVSSNVPLSAQAIEILMLWPSLNVHDVGIEQEVINEKFGEFLSGNTFNSQQQEFVKQIIDYVRENGDIKAEDLIEKSPFDNADIVTLFGANVSIITNIVATIHSSIVAA